MAILNASDFDKGTISIAQNDYNDIETGILEFDENSHVKRILGLELGGLFIADLVDGVPQEQRFVDIFNAFNFLVGNCQQQSKGLKEILRGLFYSFFTVDQFIFNQLGGNASIQQEASTNDDLKGIVIHNRQVNEIDVLRLYLLENKDVYPEFEVQYFYEYRAAQ